MKKFLFLISTLLFMLALVSCNTKPEDENPPPPPPEYITVTYKEGDTKVFEQNIVKGTAFAEADLAVKDGIMYKGYSYAGWYTDKNILGTEYDFTDVLDTDLTLYGDRGRLAGKNVVWSYDSTTKVLKFEGSGPMFAYESSLSPLWKVYADEAVDIEIGEGITTVANNAFMNFSLLSEVTLPEGITHIGGAAFYKSSVSDINFPKSLLEVGEQSFFGCNNLTALYFNDGLQNVGQAAFYECMGIEKVILTNKIAVLGGSAFYKCENIRSAYYVGTKEQYEDLTIRLDNFWIDQLANTYFKEDEKPAERGPYWYYDENGDVKQWYYSVGYYSPDNTAVPFTYDYVDPDIGVDKANIDFKNSIVYHGYKFSFFYREGWKSYTVGTKLTGDIELMGNRGNRCGDSLTWSLSGSTLTIKGTGKMWDFLEVKDAPWYNRLITKIVIKDGVEYIGSYAFSDLNALEYLDIPTNVTGIHQNAFSGCTSLKYIFYLGDKTQLNDLSVYCPSGDALNPVKDITRLNNLLAAVVYTNSADGESGEGNYWRDVVGDDNEGRVAWTFGNGALTIGGYTLSGLELLPNTVNYLSVEDTPWYSIRDSITSVSVRDGIIILGRNTFKGFTSVTEINMPQTVEKIALSSVEGTGYYNNRDNWTDGMLYVNEHLIKADASVVGELAIISERTLSIAEDAFLGCSQIKKLVIPSSLVGIYDNSFEGLDNLEAFLYRSGEPAWEFLKSENPTAFADFEDTEVYFYSKNAPTVPGKWWHFTGSKSIEIWPEVPTSED